MRINDTIITALKMIGIVIAAAVVGMLLLWAVYFLPVEPMAKNIKNSQTALKELDDYQFILDFEFWKAYDRSTNIIMLHEVIYPNTGNELRDALLVPTGDYISHWDEDWADVLHDYATNRSYTEGDYISYARYWHGYLICLKPLFMVMDLGNVNTLNILLVFTMIICSCYLMFKRLGLSVIAYIFAIVLMNPINIALSFQLSTAFYVMQVTMILLLLKDKWEKKQLLYIFVLDGILLSYFDFLTYPLAAYAFPILTCYFLYKENEIKNNLINLVCRSVAFLIGYGGMWGMKWIFASLLTEENVIKDAINSVLQRTGMTQNESDSSFIVVSVKNALELNLYSFFNIQNVILIVLMVVLSVIYIYYNKKRFVIDKQNILICLIMMISPFIWMIVLKNHCSLHPHLEWRTFSVFIYAITLLIFSSIDVQRDISRRG